MQAYEKECAMKLKERNKERKNDCCVKIFLMEGRTLYGCIRSPI